MCPIEPSAADLAAAYAAAGLDAQGNFKPASSNPAPAPAHANIPGLSEHPTSQLDGQGRQNVLGVEKRPAFSDDQITAIGQSIIDAKVHNAREAAKAANTPFDEAAANAAAVKEVEAALQADGYEVLPDDNRSPELIEMESAGLTPPTNPADYGPLDWSQFDLGAGADVAELDADMRGFMQSIDLPVAHAGVLLEALHDGMALDNLPPGSAERAAWHEQQRSILDRLTGGQSAAAIEKAGNLLRLGDKTVTTALIDRGALSSAASVVRLAQVWDTRQHRLSLSTRA